MTLTKEQFNKASTHPLQTWEWGEFRKKTGNIVVRFGFGQITMHKIPFTNYFVAVFVKSPALTKKQLKTLLDYLKEKGVIFIKIEPNIFLANGAKQIALLKSFNAVEGKRLFTKKTFIIDLSRSEDEILAGFHPKTRYNIRLSQKKGVVVEIDNSDEAFEKYLELTFETAKRQGFFAHTRKYHTLMWEHLHKNMKGKKIANLLVAKYEGEILGTWILFSWQDTLYYPYGASSSQHKEVMASTQMMWEAIRYGKRLGLKKFDLWGYEEGKGFTKFKEGFGPEVVEFVGSFDVPINKPLYLLYREADKLRWALLRLKRWIGR